MSKIVIELTENELDQILSCLGNGFADGDFNDWIASTSPQPAVDKRALQSGWKKMLDAQKS